MERHTFLPVTYFVPGCMFASLLYISLKSDHCSLVVSLAPLHARTATKIRHLPYPTLNFDKLEIDYQPLR
jgi:hypothetical protein